MMKNIKKSKLAKVILAAVMAMSVYGTAFAAPGNIEPAGTTNTHGYEVHVTHSITTDSNGLKDANIIHPALDHSSSCGEYVHDTNLTIGNINKVYDAFYDNDQKLYEDIQAEATARKNADIVSGKVEGNNLVLVGGDKKTKATIDVTSLKKDTYVTSGSYDSDSQTITLKQNEGQKDINIKLDNIAKADDLTNLENRVSNNETHITDLQGDVTNIKNDITTIKGDVTNLENRVSTNENNITTLQGEVIESGHMDGNTLVLVKDNQSTVEVDGIATTGDVDKVQNQVDQNRENIQKESSERKEEDARLNNRLQGVESDINDINGRLDRMDGKIEKGVALAIAHASLKPLDYDPQYKWSGAMGVGSYKSKNAIAAGLFYHENKDVMFNISVSACEGDTGVGAGVAVRFK